MNHIGELTKEYHSVWKELYRSRSIYIYGKGYETQSLRLFDDEKNVRTLLHYTYKCVVRIELEN